MSQLPDQDKAKDAVPYACNELEKEDDTRTLEDESERSRSECSTKCGFIVE
jgi:hypothetical protein